MLGSHPLGALRSFLTPACNFDDDRLMRCCLVSTRVNHVANDDAECSAPVEPADAQKPLFS
jgi:hypothetical protein